MKYSIITPVTYDKDSTDELRMPRYKMFGRCIASVIGQSFTDYEWIVVDDKSNPPVNVLNNIYENVKVVTLSEKSGRVIARNAGMKEAQGEWICWLDADDEYASFYLEALNDAIRLYPDYKVFNFNHLCFSYNYSTYIRKFINMDVQGDKPFPSGTIGAGAFIFKRELLDEVGYLPEMGLWDMADWAFEKFPEVKPFYESKDSPGGYNSLGNPWGEDWLMFYMLTRNNKSKYLDFAPYYVHSRWGHRWPDDPDYVVDPGKAPELNPNNI